MGINCRTCRLIFSYVCYLCSNFIAFDTHTKIYCFLTKKGPFFLVRIQNKVLEEKEKETLKINTRKNSESIVTCCGFQ